MTKVALITGACSGIGLAISLELAQRGYPLLLISNQQAALQARKTEIEKVYGVACFVFSIDLCQTTAPKEIMDYCLVQQLEVEVLVNNAGMLLFSEIVEATPEKINAILQLHILTPTMLCRLFGAEMKRKKSGHILNVASISSVMPYPGISIYGPSKTYMRYFTRALRSEMGLYSVKITCLLPGATQTALYDPNRLNLSLAKKLGVMHSAEFVAGQAVKALFNNQGECVPGWLNKLTMLAMPLTPTWVINLIYRKSNLLNAGSKSLG